MNSPRVQRPDEFDATIGRELKAWAGRQQPPAAVRAAILQAAAERSPTPAKAVIQGRSPVLQRIQQWLVSPHGRRQPQLPYSELSQWLFTEAMWHSLGIDRRAVRYVC